ncbi:unnamed protein product [Brassica napus]|uniref:(rape) hypothetical protein n=1 Tax=Brassica napus TaxID=3708 RepID=A0A816ZFJ2_BRANA|nr:unnamed protein product [Brassica napus]
MAGDGGLSDDGGALGIRAVAGRWFVFGEVGFCVMACSFRLSLGFPLKIYLCLNVLQYGWTDLSSSYLLWLWKDFDLCRLLALEGKCSLPAYVYSTAFHPF